MTSVIDTVLTEHEKQTVRDVIDALRKANMMTEALEVISRRFALQPKAIADWYYTQSHSS